MKKKYEKPLIAVENYMLTQAIASCETKIGFLDSACVIDDVSAPDGFRNLAYGGMFTDQCDYAPKIGDKFDNICYHTSAAPMFNS